MKEQDRNLEYFDDLDKLESLKQEYNNIPVPEAAKARIMSGIQKGKTMNKKHRHYCCRCCSSSGHCHQCKPNHCQCHDKPAGDRCHCKSGHFTYIRR